MKTFKLVLRILPLFAILFMACNNEPKENLKMENKENTKTGNNENLIVLVKYKSQPGKSSEAISGLTKLIEEVKNEPNFVNITLHVDAKDSSNILLYEEWSDENYYTGDHMKTSHLQNFMQDSRAFLAGPPEISQWKIEKKY